MKRWLKTNATYIAFFFFSCALVQCRLRGIKADRDAVREKLQINFEFVESLQEKMIKIFNDREAWKRR